MLKSLFPGKNIHRGSALRNTLQSKEVYFVKSLIINSKQFYFLMRLQSLQDIKILFEVKIRAGRWVVMQGATLIYKLTRVKLQTGEQITM